MNIDTINLTQFNISDSSFLPPLRSFVKLQNNHTAILQQSYLKTETFFPNLLLTRSICEGYCVIPVLGFSPPEFLVHMRLQRDSVNCSHCSVTGERKTQKVPNTLPQVQPQHYPAHLLGQYNNVHPSSRAGSSPGDPDVPSPDCFTNKHLSHHSTVSQHTNCPLSGSWELRGRRKHGKWI